MSEGNRETKGFWGFLKSKTNLNKGDYRVIISLEQPESFASVI